MANAGSPGQAHRPLPTSRLAVARKGEVFVKRYAPDLAAYASERAVLAALGAVGMRPVPRVLETVRFRELCLAALGGGSGQDVVARGHAPALLRAMGMFLGRLHALDATPLAGIVPGSRPVLVHGDFALYDVLADADDGTLTGVGDWEEAHLGDSALDLAWCEWQFATRYPEMHWALSHLSVGYTAAGGVVPDTAARAAVLRRRLATLRDRTERRQQAGENVPVLYRCAFDNPWERRAFAAALSRFLHGPDGVAFRDGPYGATVWMARGEASGTPVLYLSGGALRAAAARFGAPPGLEAVPADAVPAGCEPLYGVGNVTALGVDDVPR